MRRERTTGAVAFRHCSCQMKQMDGRMTPMKLVVDGVQRVGPPIVVPVDETAGISQPIEAVDKPAEQATVMSDIPLSEPAAE